MLPSNCYILKTGCMYRLFAGVVVACFALLLTNGCKSASKVTSSFEDVLYAEGRPVIIKVKDENEERKFNFYFYNALRFGLKGDVGNSAMYFNEAIKIDSACATCYYEIGNLLINNQEYIEAQKFIFKAVQYDPDNEHFLYLLSKLYAHNGDMENALLSAEYLVGKFGNNLDYLYHLSQLQAQSGDFISGIRTLERIEGRMGVNEAIALEKHAMYLHMGDVKGAENVLVKLCDSYPLNGDYKVYLGDFLMQQKQSAKALEIYNSIVRNYPSNGQVYFSLANYYFNINDQENFKFNLEYGFSHSGVDLESKVQRLVPFLMSADSNQRVLDISDLDKYFNCIIKSHPYEAFIYKLYGNFLGLIGRDLAAISSYETSLLIDEKQADVWQDYLLKLSEQVENRETFLKESVRAVDLYPDNGIFNYLCGLAYMFSGQDGKAIEYLKSASELVEDNDGLLSVVYGILGDLYYNVGSRDESFSAYEKSIALKNDNIAALNNYAYYLSIEGIELAKAETMISKVIELEPLNPTYLDTYAWILFKRENYLEALYFIEQAISNGGADNGVILEHYGDILFKNGNLEEALKYWKQALSTEDEISGVLEEKIRLMQYIPE